ncbi:MAG: hypothetical protein ACYCW6_27145 [Candidatus Xenobia bacterium]
MIAFVKHVTGLFSTPRETLAEVKRESWLNPLLGAALSVGVFTLPPWGNPERMYLAMKAWVVTKALMIVAVWLAGLMQGGRGSLGEVAKVWIFLGLADGGVMAFLRQMPALQGLLATALPLLTFLAVKAVHDYDNDGLAFRVTTSAYFILLLLAMNVLPGAGLPLAAVWGRF